MSAHVIVFNGAREVTVSVPLLYAGIDFAVLEVEGCEVAFGVRSGLDAGGRYVLERGTHERLLVTSARLRALREERHV